MTRYLLIKWRDLNETFHKCLSCEWALLKRFSRSEGQRSRSRPDELTYNGGGIHFDGVASRRTSCCCRCCCYYYKIHSLSYAKQLLSLQSLCIYARFFFLIFIHRSLGRWYTAYRYVHKIKKISKRKKIYTHNSPAVARCLLIASMLQ